MVQRILRPDGKRLQLAVGALPGAGLLVLVLYLACYLVAGAALRDWMWAQGYHATPEQLTYHQQLERLGIFDHHGADAAGASAADQDRLHTTLAVKALDAPTASHPVIVVAPPAPGASPEGSLYLNREAHAAPAPPVTEQPAPVFISAGLTGVPLAPLEKPPRFGR